MVANSSWLGFQPSTVRGSIPPMFAASASSYSWDGTPMTSSIIITGGCLAPPQSLADSLRCAAWKASSDTWQVNINHKVRACKQHVVCGVW